MLKQRVPGEPSCAGQPWIEPKNAAEVAALELVEAVVRDRFTVRALRYPDDPGFLGRRQVARVLEHVQEVLELRRRIEACFASLVSDRTEPERRIGVF